MSIFISRMCQDRLMDLNAILVEKIVHVDLEEMETERKIVHVHEDLRVKSTVRV